MTGRAVLAAVVLCAAAYGLLWLAAIYSLRTLP